MVSEFQLLKQGTATILPSQELEKKLSSGKKLKVKLGADPTAPDLHLGHAVILAKLRQFQDLGHDVIFLIGDFTARIGDPTGKSKTRPPLSEQQIQENSATYFRQVSRILDPAKLTVVYNSTWLSSLTSSEWVKLCAQVTLARVIEREDFAQRLEHHQSIGFHELLYPILQGYDSVALHADVELGGTDQTFNLLMGRFLQEQYGQEPQVIITLPLLIGTDGTAKMSKSLGNAIGLNEPADQAYGKIMSISDELMWSYYQLLLNATQSQIEEWQNGIGTGTAHPMELKKQLAHRIIEKFWSPQEAVKAQAAFEHLFQQKDYQYATHVTLSQDTPISLWVVDLLKLLGAVSSSSEARRLIEAGAVTINNSKCTDFKAQISLDRELLVRVGKHKFYTVVRQS